MLIKVCANRNILLNIPHIQDFLLSLGFKQLLIARALAVIMKTTTITIFTLFISLTSLFGQTRKDSLLVFIGEEIEVKYSPEEKKESPVDTIIDGTDTSYVRHVSVSMDSRYLAKYKVLRLISGSYKQDTIEFIAFDHYGEPAFSKYKIVLLFVSSYKDKLYHEKYQYFDLYLTTENKWASPYSSGDYNHPFKDKITVKPEKISFKDEISVTT